MKVRQITMTSLFDAANDSATTTRNYCQWPMLLMLGAGLLTGCKEAAPPPPPPPGVVVMDVSATNVMQISETIGQLDSPQNIEIRARVEAFVEAMPFAEGTEVKRGELLFKLDDGPYQERLAAAKGGLAEASASLKKCEADVYRLEPLAEKRAVPQQDLDNALASVDVAKAAVLSAQARVDAANLDLSYCTITAPTNGLIGARQVSIGELVGKGQPTLLATMSTLDPIWFYCNVAEVGLLRAHALAEKSGKRISDFPVTLVLGDGSVHPEKGKIVFVDRAVDVKTGTLRVRAEFSNPRKVLRPGMFGRIRVEMGERANSVLVPERAITELQGKNFVWVLSADNKVNQRPIKVGQQYGESLLVEEGLKAGERILIEGLQKVREGALVQPMTVAEATALAQKAAGASKPPENGETKDSKE